MTSSYQQYTEEAAKAGELLNESLGSTLTDMAKILNSPAFERMQELAVETSKTHARFVESFRPQITVMQKLSEAFDFGFVRNTTLTTGYVEESVSEGGCETAVLLLSSKTLPKDDIKPVQAVVVPEVVARVPSHFNEGVVRICLDPKSNTLYRFPKSERKLRFRSNDKIKLLRALSHEYTGTEELLGLTFYTKKRTVTTTMYKLKKVISKELGVDFDIIEGSVGKGYRLSPRCIILNKEDICNDYGA